MNRTEVTIPEILFSPDLGTSSAERIQTALTILEKHCETAKEYLPYKEAVHIAEILISELNLTAEPVVAALLRKPIETGLLSSADVEKGFGKPVAGILIGLQKIKSLTNKKFTSNTENFIKFLLTVSEDIRVVLIRLGQCIYDIRNIADLPPEQQKMVVEEANLLYIPIAHRIGLYRIKTELEDRVLAFTQPGIYDELARKIRETQKDRDRYAREFIRPLEKKLREAGFDCEIKSRIKSIPSIYRKMLVQKVEFEKVYDLFAIRIILNKVTESESADCWRVYSIVTDTYTPNSRRLRDWISFPKPTGYESLHTTVIGPDGKWVEVQIRTRRMDDIAEKSLAAHWKYKEGKKSAASVEFYAMIRETLEKPVNRMAEDSLSAEKKALYTDEIFIFTPNGDLKRLRAGYTVLDFAYEIHTDLGSTCTGAIVNGVMVPMRHVLKNGDTVKILTSKNQKPNSEWLEFVKSPRVTTRIRHALKMENYKESDTGKEIIKNKVIQLGETFTDPLISKLVLYFECESPLDLYQKFGEGRLDPMKIKKALLAISAPPAPAIVKEETFPERFSGVMTGKQDYIIIDKNIRSVHYEFAHCCNPVPGDTIFAFVSVTHGIRVHKTNCPNARDLVTRYPYRILDARWRPEMDE